jgi:excisionase family DNA binding protein
MATPQSIEDHIRRLTPVAAPPEQREQVAALARALGEMGHDTPTCQIIGPGGQAFAIPESVFHLLERVIQVMARGDSVTIVPIGKEVTTQQAANLLNVSRQYLVRLLDEGRIPHRRTGKHRRLRIDDVLAYKRQRDRDRRTDLRELSRLTQEVGGYDAELK